MLGEKAVQTLTKQVLSHVKADQAEVVVLGEDSGLTRFANSYIHQNVAETNYQVRVRAVVGKKVGVAATNDTTPEGLREVAASAVTIAKLQPENPDFKSLPAPVKPIPRVEGFVERTAQVTPEDRARAVSVMCQKCKDANVVGSGALETSINEMAVANSLGVWAYFATTRASINTVVMSDTGSGYASRTSLDYSDLDFEALADEAVAKSLKSRNPIAADSGEYTVILEEHAVADMVAFLGYLGFSAQAVQEGRSFMKLGEIVVGRNISIWDDGLDVHGLPQPFDFEGVPKSRLSLIENGIAKAVVYDSYTAGKEGRQSTGHALPAPNTFGPVPTNMFMATGEHTKEDMLKSTKRGIWVTRFWYTRPVHPLKVIVTGTTRDGTFLIENGELTRPVRNFRFTQSYLDALSNVEMIGKTAKTVTSYMGASHVPALKISRFMFTGSTLF